MLHCTSWSKNGRSIARWTICHWRRWQDYAIDGGRTAARWPASIPAISPISAIATISTAITARTSSAIRHTGAISVLVAHLLVVMQVSSCYGNCCCCCRLIEMSQVGGKVVRHWWWRVWGQSGRVVTVGGCRRVRNRTRVHEEGHVEHFRLQEQVRGRADLTKTTQQWIHPREHLCRVRAQWTTVSGCWWWRGWAVEQCRATGTRP